MENADALRLGDLAAAEGIAPSTLTRLVTALEEAGYVRGTRCLETRGRARCRITPDGRAVLDRIRQETTMALAGMLLDLTPDQRAPSPRRCPR